MIRLERHSHRLPVVSIIPLVDVLLILLVFFMVTSTFLDLDMLPMSETEAAGTAAHTNTGTTLIRILPGGSIATGGQRIAPDGIDAYLVTQAGNRVLLLPSPHADVQALVRVLDAATRLGVTTVSVLQFAEDS